MIPSDKNRWYTRPPNTDSLGFGYGYSPVAVGTGGGSNPVTGIWTPLSVDANGYLNTNAGIQITGSLNATINSVGITGAPVMTLTGNTPVTIVNPVLAVSGSFSATPPPIQAISGIVTTAAAPLQAISGFTIEIGTGNRSVLVVNTAPINVTGIILTQVTGSITSTPAAATAITGNPGVTVTGFNTGITVSITDNLGWALLSGISGALTSNLSTPAAVTGLVSITSASQTNALLTGISGLLAGNLTDTALVNDVTGNLYLAAISGKLNGLIGVTGNFTTSNPVGVTGTSVDKGLPTMPGSTNFLAIGGRVVNASGAGSITGYNSTGDLAILNIAPNGGLFVSQGCLAKDQDESTVWPASTGAMATNPSTSGINNAGWGLALPANPNRRGWFAQSMATGVIYLGFGFNPTSGAFNVALKGGTSQFDASAASFSDWPSIWQGDVRATGYFNVNPVYTIWQV